jgi:hypothetical protein
MVFYGMLSYSHAGSESTHPLSYVLPTRIGAEAQLFNDTGSLMGEYTTTGFIKGAGMQREWCRFGLKVVNY